MRRSTLKDLNIRWWYWLVVLTFGVAGIAAFLAVRLEGEDAEGLVWNDQLFGTGLIPWSEIAEARCYIHRQTFSSPPSFGLRIVHSDNLKLSGTTNRKLTENLKRWGWHCYYHSESVLLPLQTIEKTVNFYKGHPEARWELSTGSALDRIAGFEPVETVGHS